MTKPKNKQAQPSSSNPKKNPASKGKKDAVTLSNEQIDQIRKSRRAELSELGDEELRERFLNANGTAAEETASREDIIERIIELGIDKQATLLRQPGEGKGKPVFGNKSKDIAIDESIAKDPKHKESVIVKITPTTWADGQIVNLDKQAWQQTYTVDDFNQLLAEKFFSDAGYKLDYLNKPSGVEEPAEEVEE